MNDFFTVNELAEHFRVNPKTIYRRLWAKGSRLIRWANNGELLGRI